MDELMMDWLYDELDPASSARVTAHMDACIRCSGEIASLRRTREAFRDLPALEPPPSVSAILLHEAARRAPAAVSSDAAAARPGLVDRLRRWFGPLVLHPALTAAATVVLLAGVGGVLYMRGGRDMARSGDRSGEMMAAEPAPPERATSASSDTASALPPSAPAPARPPGTSSATPPASESSKAIVARLADGKQQAELDEAQGVDALDEDGAAASAKGDVEDNRKAAKTKIPEPAPAEEPSETQAAESEKTSLEQAPARSERRDRSQPPRRVDPDRTRARGERAAPPVSRGAPEPAPVNAVSGAGPAADPEETQLKGRSSNEESSGGEAADSPAAPPKQSPARSDESKRRPYRVYRDPSLSRAEQGWLEIQEMKLGELSRNRRCREAAAIANDILDRNPEFYARRVKTSKEVQQCDWYVGNEQRRRAQLRAAKPASRAKTKGAAAPPGARAAPAKDEAPAPAEQQRK